MRRSRRDNLRGHTAAAAFTLIELIIVLLLLAIAASMVAPRMSSFFRGRAVNHEARRLLSLTHYAQSRAVAEGVPIMLWIDPRTAHYGVEAQAGTNGGDERAREFTAEPTLTLSFPALASPAAESEQGDESFGLPEGRAAIRFLPDGFIDEVSVPRVQIQQQDGPVLELALKENRLGYEILSGEARP
jgi:type II secretion system protein H